MVGELSRVRDALAAPALKLPVKLTYHDTGHSLDRGIEWIAKPHGRDTLLIAVNADGNPVDVTFGGLGRFKNVESRSGVTSFTWTKGSLRERFEPFGTRVWKLG